MLRRSLARYLVALAFTLSATMPILGVVNAGPTGGVPTALAASTVHAVTVEPALDGPGHHFGFTEASVLMQATPNVPVGLAGLQQLPNVPVQGWSNANPPSFDIQSFDP
ncbi:MAG TPA: hypothetical protein VII06_28145, partial [Chloroflexota bacterium]